MKLSKRLTEGGRQVPNIMCQRSLHLWVITQHTHIFPALYKEETLADCDSRGKVLHTISVLEQRYLPQVIGAYVHLTSEAYKAFPTFQLIVLGKQVTFMSDSGATSSVVKSGEFDCPPKLSGNQVYSMSASGQVVKEKMTTAIVCVTPDGLSFKHSFLLSELCPINLMGRDLMCKLGTILTSTPEGVKVMVQPDKVFTAVQLDSLALTYPYQWKLPTSPFSQQLMKGAKALVSPLSDFMQSADLHCTSHISLGPDYDHEKKWFRTLFEKICTTTLFWNSQTAALAVSLTPAHGLDHV